MRKIKFKAWDKREKFMYKWKQVHDGNFDDMRCDRSIILLQYIGWKDKNGKEIYEGDIIAKYDDWDDKFDNKKSTIGRGKVIWWDSGFEIELINPGKLYWRHGDFFTTNEFYGPFHGERRFVWNYLEVIGNIYENPELLKEVKLEERN